jgi:hypothetical protein
VFSLTPLPISIIRVLAPASGYPIGRYVAAQIVGRLPRFYVLAWLGRTIDFPTWILGLMFVVLLVTFWFSGRSTRIDPANDEDDPDTEDDAEPEPGSEPGSGPVHPELLAAEHRQP